MDFKNIKIGDTVIRMICGMVPSEIKVTEIDAEFIHCGPWKFSRVTGREYDEELGWNDSYTGSFLKS